MLPAKWDQLDRNGQNDDVIDTLSETIRLYAGRADGHYSRGCAYYENEQYDLAIKDFTDAIELKPDAQAAYYRRGAAFVQSNKYGLAIVDLTTAIILSGEVWQKASADDLRGMAYQKIGEQAKANGDFAKAKELESKR